jgi:hypothetical protein
MRVDLPMASFIACRTVLLATMLFMTPVELSSEELTSSGRRIQELMDARCLPLMCKNIRTTRRQTVGSSRSRVRSLLLPVRRIFHAYERNPKR